MLFNGLIDLSFWGYVLVALGLTHVTIVSVTIFLHRHQAHRALSLHPAVSHFFRFWLWLTTGMVTREWAAVHRKHHARCESREDPHSPQQVGLARVLFQGAWLYRQEAVNQETIDAFGHGTPDDWLERHIYGRLRFTGLGIMLLADGLLFGLAGGVIWLVQMAWIPFWAAGVINGVGHYWGYRNFETQDASRNIVPWGILIGGEELHNNHHAYGVSARLSNKWWEFDIGWLYIRTLEMLGLAEVRRVAPKTTFAQDLGVVDMDMLRAVVANRFHVLKLYGNHVVAPVLRAQARIADADFGRRHWRLIKRRLVSENPAHRRAGQERLAQTLAANQTLKTIYEFKQRLKAVWTQRSKDQAELLARLQAWCVEAEASGIAALREFSMQLRGYRSQLAAGA